MDITSRVTFEQLRKDFQQKCTTETPTLGFLVYEDNLGHVKTDMDIQRKYVWNEAREQEMWDTLLLDIRIPEFHAILDGRVRNICDGKQRFTCIFKIMRNEIPFKRSYARPELKWLFNARQNQIFFKDLPMDLQDDISNKQIQIARYENLTREEQIDLFRKINNGVALSPFAKGMSSYYYMRNEFTEDLLNMPQLTTPTFNEKPPEVIEMGLVRALILTANTDNIDLQANGLEKYYANFKNVDILSKYKNEMKKTIERFPKLETILGCRSYATIFPFVLEAVYKHPELTSEQIAVFCAEIINFHSGRGNDLGASGVRERRKYINELLESIKSTVVI